LNPAEPHRSRRCEPATSPSLRPFHRLPLAPTDTALTPEQLLELDTILPMRVRSSGPEIAEAVHKSLQRWAREHPALAHRQPAADMMSMATYDVARSRLEVVSSPVAGTYRLILVAPPADTARLFVRMDARPAFLLMSANGDRSVVRDGQMPRAAGYYLLTQGAGAIADLPATRFERTRHSVEGYFTVGEQPVLTTPDRTVWLGGADISRIVAVIDPHFGSRSPALALSLAAQSFARSRNLLPGRFVLTSDGRMTYTEPAERDSTTALIIRGERISHTSLSHVLSSERNRKLTEACRNRRLSAVQGGRPLPRQSRLSTRAPKAKQYPKHPPHLP
jgi:hypothetical protein